MKIKLLADNPYGYRVDIFAPELAELFKRYKKWKNIPDWCPLSDKERFEFEGYILGKKSKNESESAN